MRLISTAGLCSLLATVLGCATSYPVVDAPPLAEDLAWSAPSVVLQPTLEPPGPAPEPATPRSPKEKVYAFAPGDCYRVDVAVGAGTLLLLKPGEEIRDWGDGDRSPVDTQDQK